MLQVVDGVFYEGTGLNGRSSIRKVKIETGEVLQKRDVPAEHFGEGITVRGSELFELTWQTNAALVYDKATFTPKRQYKYTGEGWGLTQDKTSFYMSDGSEFLRIYAWPALVPAVALMSFVLGLNLLADSLREQSLRD